jgi:hypothetical protein
MASCIFQMRRASGWSGTRRRSPLTWLTASSPEFAFAISEVALRGTRQAAASQSIKAKSLRIWCLLGRSSGCPHSAGVTLGQRAKGLCLKIGPPKPNNGEEEAWPRQV